MKRGFTLLELLIVIIIVGVLATLGLTQYSSVVEKSRGAEARQILGQLRNLCAGIYQANQNANECTAANLGIGTNIDQIPNACTATMRSHYFRYIATPNDPDIVLRAVRCEGNNGKQPGGPAGTNRELNLTAEMDTGNTTWGTNFGY